MTEENKYKFMLEEMEITDDEDLKTITDKADLIPEAVKNTKPADTVFNGVDIPNDISDMLGDGAADPTDKADAPTADGDKVMFNLSELMPPDTVVDMIDFIFPMLIVLLAGYFNKEIEGASITLSKEEKKTIEKPLKRALEQTQTGTKSPWIALLIVVIFIYGGKMFAAIMEAKTKLLEAEEKAAERKANPEYNIPAPAPAKNTTTVKKKDGRGRPKGSVKFKTDYSLFNKK